MAKKKSRRLTYKRLDLDTLDGAHRHFSDLAESQPEGDVKEALHLAAVITHTLSQAVGIAVEVNNFLDVVGRGR
jgi:hypothetical protein